jgi:hypothetical protein
VTWLNRERLTIYPRIILVGYILCGAGLALSAACSKAGLTDFLNRPLGADFSHYWLASALAQAGHPLTVYWAPEFIAALNAYFKVAYPVPWLYPPTFLLLIYPLAFLPYLASLGLWLALAFPGMFQNFFNGQNDFLTIALLGGGLYLLDQSPWAAGCLLGLVSYKPHLFVLVPVALIAARRGLAQAGAGYGAVPGRGEPPVLRPGGLGGLREQSGPLPNPGPGGFLWPIGPRPWSWAPSYLPPTPLPTTWPSWPCPWPDWGGKDMRPAGGPASPLSCAWGCSCRFWPPSWPSSGASSPLWSWRFF